MNKMQRLLLGGMFVSPLFALAQSTPPDALKIDPAGNVGIGVEQPEYQLDVADRVLIRSGKKGSAGMTLLPPGGQGITWFIGLKESNIAGFWNSQINDFTLFVTAGDGNLYVRGDVHANGNIRAQGSVLDKNGYVVPSGSIVMFNGNFEEFGSDGKGKADSRVWGWALCDGRNETPNLTEQFVMGASARYRPRTQGGSNTRRLTVAQMPAHEHVFGVGGNSGTGQRGGNEGNVSGNTSQSTTTASAGGGQEFDIRPAYTALIYIMKL